ncbi:MAG: hypothetical protein ACREIT_04155 [Tepidisphaeraceae bacterium]
MALIQQANPPSPPRNATVVAWQGWRLSVPGRWSPVKLEGDYEQGYALFADLHRPRLGMRWQKLRQGRKFKPEGATHRAMREEVGKLAADEARPHAIDGRDWAGPVLYLDPEPPGRDVWAGWSRSSGRLVQLIHHARHRERILPDMIVPALQDLPAGPCDRAPWSVFELSCVAPAGFKWAGQRLNAGDLSLTFQGKNQRQAVTVRQVAVARLALQRMKLEQWLAAQQNARRKHHRPTGASQEVEIQVRGRPVKGHSRRMRRRFRFVWMWWQPGELFTYALHDQRRDRLVVVEGTNRQIVTEVAESVGWASDMSSPSSS